MKLISWNIAGKVSTCAEQVSALSPFEPDMLALQEVRFGAVPRLTDAIIRIGLGYIIETTDLAKDFKRPYGVLIASRWPCVPLSTQFDIPFKERALSVNVEGPCGKIDLHTVHIPPGNGNGWIKIDTFEGIYRHLARASKIPRILCGDFNSPKMETDSGEVVTWGQRIKHGREIVIQKGFERWDLGERSVLTGLSEYDLCDTYRYLNGYTLHEASWSRQIWKKQHGYRFDHIFASQKLDPLSCKYLHGLREAGFSDHSPIEAVFDPVCNHMSGFWT
jgi:exonuclease III